MYEVLHVLHVSLYIPLMLYSWFLSGGLWFCTVLYCVCAFECSIYVGMFEDIGEFSNLWTMVCKGCPFFVFIFILFLVDFLLLLCFQVCYDFLREVVVSCHGLYCFHSDCCLSIVSGSDCILVMWYW